MESLELKALELPTNARDDLQVDALEQALKSKPGKACLLSSGFNNPLDSSLSNVNKQRVLDPLHCQDVPLIEDDIFGDIHFGTDRSWRSRRRPTFCIPGPSPKQSPRLSGRMGGDTRAHADGTGNKIRAHPV